MLFQSRDPFDNNTYTCWQAKACQEGCKWSSVHGSRNLVREIGNPNPKNIQCICLGLLELVRTCKQFLVKDLISDYIRATRERLEA